MARFNFTSGRAHGCVGSLEYQMRGGVCVVRAKRAKVRKARMIVSNTDPYPFYEGDLAGCLVLLQSGLLYQETQTGFMADKRIVPELYHDCVFRITFSIPAGGMAAGDSMQIGIDGYTELNHHPNLFAAGTVIAAAVLYCERDHSILSKPFPVRVVHDVLGDDGMPPFSIRLKAEDIGGGEYSMVLELNGAYRDMLYYPGTLECRFHKPLWGHSSLTFEGLEDENPVKDGMTTAIERGGTSFPLGVMGTGSFTREDTAGDYIVVAKNISLATV